MSDRDFPTDLDPSCACSSNIAELKQHIEKLTEEKSHLVKEKRQLTKSLKLKNVQTVILENAIAELQQENLLLKAKVSEINNENKDLKTEANVIKKKFEDESSSTFLKHVIENDDNCRIYTGFPSVEQLNNIYRYLDPGPRGENVVMYNPTTNSRPKKADETRGRKRAFTPFTSYVLTLCRIKCNFSISRLSWLFEGKESTVSTVFITWINFMYLRLASVSISPTREIVKRHMPKSMAQKFPNVRAIIDCFEIFTEVPSSLTLHKVMFSTYKNHTTVKCLEAIAPGGGFSFVSALFPGKMSDREMVSKSGLLDERLWEKGDGAWRIWALRWVTSSNHLA